MDSVIDTKIKLRRAAHLAGALITAGAVIGLLGQVYGMFRSYSTIEKKPAPTPDDLALGVTISLASSVVGFLLGVLGVILLLRALSKLKRLERPIELRKS